MVYVLTFIASFCFVVGAFSYLGNDKKIKVEHCLIGIALGIFGAAIVGMSYDMSKNDLKKQTIQKESCNDNKE